MERERVVMTMTLDIMAQKIINQVILSNEEIAGQLKAGIEKGFKYYDFEGRVAVATREAIDQEIKKSANWDKLRQIVKQKADEIIDRHIEKELEKLKQSL